jgi:hypothetical protein
MAKFHVVYVGQVQSLNPVDAFHGWAVKDDFSRFASSIFRTEREAKLEADRLNDDQAQKYA